MDYQFLEEAISKKHEKFVEIANEIWGYAELAYKEHNSSELQQAFLKKEGFEVEEGIAGIETAFLAKFGSGKPVIGYLGEFDALPELSQKANEKVHSPLEEGAPGHGCGHHLLGTGLMQAAVAVKDYLEEEKLSGTVIYFGCPAEEGGAGKAFMVREGVFDQCDACLAWHPGDVTVSSVSTLSNARVFFNFKGISAHAAVAPHLGRSALDSVELMNVGVNYLREHMIPEARVHYAVTDTGGNAPNVVQAKAQVLYSIRAPRFDQLTELIERVSNIAKGAALMCGTEVEIQIVSNYADVLQNKTLDGLIYSHVKEIFPLDYTEEELNYAKDFYEVGEKAGIEMYKNLARQFMGEAGSQLFLGPMAKGYFPPSPMKMGSTDVGDVSWNVPSAWISVQTFALGTPIHTWQAVAQGKSQIAYKGMQAAARILARTAVDIYNNPQLLEKIDEDFQTALGGRKYQSLIPADTKPGMIK
ncbi:MAG: amidohydrolase [Tissierellia bacterium]|nr:amidohydrolase [Tissierellia bacterium]